jgi:hypothetical protein
MEEGALISIVKITLLGAAFYIAFFLCLQLVAIILANYTGGVGIDIKRPTLFILHLSIWIIAFSLAYWIAPPTRR